MMKRTTLTRIAGTLLLLTATMTALWATSGSAVAANGTPDIRIAGNGVDISNGDTTPSEADHTDFGDADVSSGSVVRTFTIWNDGDADLLLTGDPIVAISGEHSAEFTVTSAPSSPVGASSGTTFNVTFDPTGTGVRSATVSITNSDAADNPYTFAIEGIGTAVLTVTDITADDKEYDGTMDATLDVSGATLVGVVGGDDVALGTSAAVGTFDSQHAGTGKTVAISGLTLSGDDSDSYTLTQPSTAASISQRAITVTAINSSKTYDGTTASAELPTITSGSLATGDTAGFVQTFDNKHIGDYDKTLTPSGAVNDGNGGANYSVTFTPIYTGTITTRAITVTAVAASKPYDSTVSSSGVPTITTGSLGAGDSVTWMQTFDFPEVGTLRTMTPAGTVNDGNGGANYDVTFATVDTGEITHRAITVTATTDTRVYDGTTDSSAMPTITSGSLVPGQTATWSQTFDNRNAGTGKTLTPTGQIDDEGVRDNYAVTFVAVHDGEITPKPLTVSGLSAEDKVYDGTTDATIDVSTAALVGVLAEDTVTLDTSSATGTFDTRDVGNSKTVTISGLTLGGTHAANYSLANPTVTASITKRAITVKAVNNSKTYDCTTSSDGVPVIISGSLGTGDNDTGSWTQVFDSKHVGASSKTLTPSGAVNDGNGGANYNVTFVPINTGTITRKAITVTATGPDTKVYDGTTASDEVPTITVGSLMGDDTVTWTQTFDTKHVDTIKTLIPHGTVVDGNGGFNYLVTFATVDTGTITTRYITVSAVADTKVYDGDTSSDETPVVTSDDGVATGDSADWTQTFDNRNVGTGKTLTPTGSIDDDNDGDNYDITFVPVNEGTITQKELTVTGITASNKTYEGNTTAAISVGSAALSGVVSGDSVTLNTGSATGAFSSKHVGSGKTVSISGLTISGTHASNYSLTQPTTTADITKRSLTVTAATDSKTYDGTTSSSATPTITSGTLASGDNDTGSWSQTFDTKHVGSNKTLTPTGAVNDGNSGDNYDVTFTGVSTGTISKRAITVTAETDTKTYDGTTSSSATPTVTSGSVATASQSFDSTGTSQDGGLTMVDAMVAGDTASWSQTFDTKHVGANKTLTPTGTIDDGNDGDNYDVTFASVSTGTISTRAITVTAATDTKGYDGTTDSDETPTITSGSLATGDSASWSQTFDTADIGSGKTLTPSGTVTDGNSGNNYDVTFATVSTGVITAESLTVTGITASNKVYNGNTTAAINTSGATLVGVRTGDDVTLVTSGASGAFSDKHVGDSKTVSISGLTLSGDDADNYSLTQPTTTANITAKGVTVSGTAAENKAYDGTAAATLDFSGASIVGAIGGDDVDLDTTSATGTFASKDIGNGKLVTVAGLALDGDDAGNYSLTQPTTTANITAKALTVTGITASNKTYDGSTSATVDTSGATLVGVVDEEDVALVTSGASGAFDNENVGSGKTVTISGLTLSGTQTGNYSLTQPTTTADISQKGLTVSGVTASNKTYDGTTDATLNTGSAALVGAIGGDVVTLNTDSASGSFDDKHVGTGKTVTVSGLSLDGADGPNYSLTQPTTTAHITTRAITVTAVTDSKEYDETTSSDETPTITSGSLATGDTATWTQTFDTAAVGENKTLTPAGTVGDGNGGANYDVTFVTVNTGEIYRRIVTVNVNLKAGWNMVSVPVNPDDDSVSAVFPGIVAVYTWDAENKTYVMPTNVEPDCGYWVAVISDMVLPLVGEPVEEWTAGLKAGWNMVGSVYGDPVAVMDLVDDPADTIYKSSVYRWDAETKTYYFVSHVVAGESCWVASTADCTVTMTAPV